MVLMVRCILYPRCNLFVTSGGKEQAAGILKDKVQEICTLIPAFKREIDWRRGKTLEGKDYCKYVFKSGSTLDNVAARESSRGKRKHGGLVEECVGVDGQILQEVIIPTMAISRRCMDGTTQPDETLNKSQVYVTTAGYKGTFPQIKILQSQGLPMVTLVEKLRELRLLRCGIQKNTANSEAILVTLCQAA